MDKFKNVPVEEDTKIIFREESILGEYEVLYEKWFWDGISAESIIFANEDVAELKDNEIESIVKKSPLLKKGSSMTLTRSESGFTFVNFNFEAE